MPHILNNTLHLTKLKINIFHQWFILPEFSERKPTFLTARLTNHSAPTGYSKSEVSSHPPLMTLSTVHGIDNFVVVDVQ